jgi:hypothetical protein
LRFSVLIPLEAHRGHALEALRGWFDQTFPRNRFELVVVAPPGHAPSELAELRQLLTPSDQLVQGVSTHDMGLSVEAAALARGELLFFTEAHCFPEADTLAEADRAADAHPEWAGFSCRSVALTTNALARVEARFYEGDIAYGMHEHPWRKVLDQCFVVRRAAYKQVGGFEATLGHFAEYVLAARLYVAGLEIGHAPGPRIHHFYPGRFGDWRRFTEDFVAGQLEFAARRPSDPVASLFDEVPEWSSRETMRRRSARRVVRLLLADLARNRRGFGDWRLLGTWFWRCTLGPPAGIVFAETAHRLARVRLELALLRRDESGAEGLLRRCCDAVATARRRRFVRAWNRTSGSVLCPPNSRGEWQTARHDALPGVGFHLASGAGDQAIRWSEPAAYVELPLQSGELELKVHWLFLPPVDGVRTLRFFLDEHELSEDDVRVGDTEATLRVRVSDGSSPSRLGWVCSRHVAFGDTRVLGLPIRAISWTSSTIPGRWPARTQSATLWRRPSSPSVSTGTRSTLS